MKKLILLLFIPLLFTCSSDDDNSNSENSNQISNDDDLILCTSYTRQRMNSNTEDYIWTASATYSGSKTISSSYIQYTYNSATQSVDEEIWYKNHIYSGDLEVSTYTNYEVNGVTTVNSVSEDYEYNDDGLIVKESITYFLNDEVISYEERFFSWTNENLTRQQTDENGQLISVINLDSNNNILEEIQYENGQIYRVISRTYDYSKNSQFKNVENFWAFGYYPHYPPNMPYQNPLISEHYSNNDCTYFYEHTYDQNDFQISSNRTSNCNSDYLVIYNWNYD